MKITVTCPSCKTKVVWNQQQSFKPFCSERCKLIDLGEWAAGEKRIPGDPVDSNSINDDDSLFH